MRGAGVLPGSIKDEPILCNSMIVEVGLCRVPERKYDL
jgi:hypothetical protein